MKTLTIKFLSATVTPSRYAHYLVVKEVCHSEFHQNICHPPQLKLEMCIVNKIISLQLKIHIIHHTIHYILFCVKPPFFPNPLPAIGITVADKNSMVGLLLEYDHIYKLLASE